MRTFYLAIIAILFATTGFAQTQTVTYSTAGQYSWTVPCGVTKVTVQVWGAGAGGNSLGTASTQGGGGGGAYSATTDIAVTAGTTYTLNVGAGASRGSGENGGLSRFRLVNTNIVLANGGGSGSNPRIGGSTTGALGAVQRSGGTGGLSASGNGGAGGGGSAGANANGANGTSNSGNVGGAGGAGGAGGGATGGDGGNGNQNGDNGNTPGSGGGQRGANGTSSGGGADGQIIITYIGAPTGYCVPSVTWGTYPITNVTFAGINRTTSNSTNAVDYESFCDEGSVQQGSATNAISLSVRNDNDNFGATVYIDWNQDGDFNDANEDYRIGGMNNNTLRTGNIAVPATALLGKTRMRVIYRYSSWPPDGNSCQNFSYGQVEDYNINVTSACTLNTAPTSASASQTTICAGASVTLTQVGGTLGSGGAKWKWYSGTTGCGTTFINETTAANGSISVSPTVTTTYNVYGEQLCGSTTTTTICRSITITVNNKPATISYTGTPFTFCTANAVNLTPSTTGGTPASYAVSPALPAGLSFSTTTGQITGTPTTPQAAANYSFTATNSCGTSTAFVASIAVSSGSQAFTITPNNTTNFCNTAGNVAMGLSGSVNGVTYQLYRGVTSVATLTGNGAALNFGNFNVAGTYTVRATSGCAADMIGQNVIAVTTATNTQFSYPGGLNQCAVGTLTPTITGGPQTGTFSSAAGLVINATTGVINLGASDPGTYTITYNVDAVNACPSYFYSLSNFVVKATPQVFDVTGGGAYCTGTTGVVVGLSGSKTGINYSLYRGATLVTTVPGTNAAISFNNQTAGTYTVTAAFASGAACPVNMFGSVVVTEKPAPSPIIISPATSSICQGNIVPLFASVNPPSITTGTATATTGTINVAIPNDNTAGLSNTLNISGIPLGASITKVTVKFKISHDYSGDLLINLKGPNGNVLNLANGIGGDGNGFNNTTITSATNPVISTSSNNTFPGTYLPQASQSVIGAGVVTSNVSNAAAFSGLYGASASSANGNWIFSVRDKEDHGWFFFDEAQGYLNDCTLTIEYSYTANPASVTWSPATDLYTDPAATVAYVANSSATTVFAKPSSAGTSVYTATVDNGNGCSTTSTASIDVKASPVLQIAADYCSNPGNIKITATSDINISNWTWSNGLGSGTVVGKTSSITPNSAGTFYITAIATGNNCPATASLSVAQELVVNGDFENGNTGFTSGYTSVAATTANGLQPSGTYTVNDNPNFNHSNFWGADHTKGNGEGKFMLVNGTTGPIVWQQTVTVLPNTVYYFSAYAASLNNIAPFANLRFNVNGSQVGTSTGALPTKPLNNNPGTWVRFYGTWNSGSNTSATIQILDLENSGTGNDFGLDDISFGTLSTFLNLTSETGTNAQTVCADAPLVPLTYEVGGNGSIPVVTGLPAGLTTYWNGREMSIKGTPTAHGTFNYQIRAEVCSGAFLTRTGTLTVIAPSKAGNFASSVASACYNTAGSISVTGTVGGVTKWQSSTSPVTTWSDISNTTSTLNYPAQTTAMSYRLIAVNGTGCKADTSVTVKVGIKNLWTGTTSGAWSTASNWSDEAVPTTSCPSVIIPVVSSNIYPSITSGTTDVVNIDVKNGASLTINGGILRVSGTIASAGGIDAKEGTIVLNGTSTQTIAGANLKDKTVKNLTIENNVSLAPSATDTLKIAGTLGFGTATGKTFAAGTNNVVLLSSINNTANVPNIGTNVISGSKFTVERFVNTGVASVANPLAHGRAWQLLSVPTNTTQTIHNAWQEGQSANADNLKGYGTLLNGPLAQGGYDNNSAGTYVKSYIPNADQWTLGNGTNAAIATKRGWMTFVMGDRSSNATNSKPTVLRTTGALFTGTQPTLSVTAGKYEVIGNPYASEIDLRELIKPSNNLTQQVYVWDPSLGAGFGFGRYRTLTFEDGDYYTVPASANYPEISNMIQSGQAFFVKSNGINPSTVTFTEAVKSNTNRVVTRGGVSFAEKLRIDLSVTQSGNPALLDGAIAFFKNEYNIAADEMDGAKLINSGENAGFRTGGKSLSVDRRPSPLSVDTLFVEMTGMKVQSYNWQVTTANMNKPGRNAWLVDNFLGTKTPLSLDGITTVSFDVTSAAASAAANRFSIVFNKIAGPLPVTFTGISASRNADRSIAVKWSVENEINLDKYTVERSADGVNFSGIITADVTNSRNYAKNDLSPLAQDNFYRIKALSNNGQIQYSAIVKVAPIAAAVPASISVYPNPVEDKTMNVSFVNQAAGTYQLQLINELGQVMYNGSVKVLGNNDRKQVNLQTVKASGSYTLKVVAEDGTANSIKLLVQ